MKPNKRKQDQSVLALLYDTHKQMHPESPETLQHEIGSLYRELYQRHLEDPEGVATVFAGMCDDRVRYAYEEGVKCGVRLSLDLGLDGIMEGGAENVSDL